MRAVSFVTWKMTAFFVSSIFQPPICSRLKLAILLAIMVIEDGACARKPKRFLSDAVKRIMHHSCSIHFYINGSVPDEKWVVKLCKNAFPQLNTFLTVKRLDTYCKGWWLAEVAREKYLEGLEGYPVGLWVRNPINRHKTFIFWRYFIFRNWGIF